MIRRNKGKKLICALLTISAFFTTSVTVSAAPKKEATWAQFRGDTLNPGITDSKIPRTAEETEQVWAKKYGTSWSDYVSDPVIVGDRIYAIMGKNVLVIDKETGKEIQKAENILLGGKGFFSRMAYAQGKLFIPVEPGRIQCVDANTLQSLWISPEVPKNFQPLSPVLYNDGQVYMGISNGTGSDGMFYALSIEDKDPTRGDEIQEYTWNYTSPTAGNNGYYWSGGAVVGNEIIFGSEKGEIVSHDLKSDKIIDTFEIHEAIRSTIHYDKNLGKIFVSTKSGNIHSININSDGTFDKLSHKKVNIGLDVTSSPVTYNGRLYVAGGGISSSSPFTVMDADSLEVIYQTDEVKSQSSPIISTGYATEGNKNTIYITVLGFGQYSMSTGSYSDTDVYVLKDFEGNTKPIVEKIAKPSEAQPNSSSAAIDEDGSIYFVNDSQNLFKFSSKNGEITADDVVNSINNLPSLDKITLNDEETIKNVMDRYKSLSEEEKAKVVNYDKLEAALQKIDDFKNADKEVERLTAEINNLPENITLENKDKVNELYASYVKLSEEHKAKITNAEKLINAKKTINDLDEEVTIKEIEEKIAALPELKDAVIDAEEIVNDVYNQFQILSKEQQEKVKNKEKLVQVKEKIEKTKAEVIAIDKDIWDKLNPENITLKDKEVVESLIKRFEALDPRDQEHVQGYQDVLDAKIIIDKLEQDNNTNDGNDNNNNNNGNDNNNNGNDNSNNGNDNNNNGNDNSNDGNDNNNNGNDNSNNGNDNSNNGNDNSNNGNDNSNNGNNNSNNVNDNNNNGNNNNNNGNNNSNNGNHNNNSNTGAKEPQNKLPNTGGVNSSVVIFIASIFLVGGFVLFRPRKSLK